VGESVATSSHGVVTIFVTKDRYAVRVFNPIVGTFNCDTLRLPAPHFPSATKSVNYKQLNTISLEEEEG
jgi:hypothetical protein